MKLSTIAYIIIAILAINYLVSSVMVFLGVEVQTYSGYLFWFFALILFWGFLPGPIDYFGSPSGDGKIISGMTNMITSANPVIDVPIPKEPVESSKK